MRAVSEPAARAGPYDVIETAYAGPFSVVYRCRDPELPREVAVKVVPADAPRVARGYALRDARLRALAPHPHVLPVYRSVRGPLVVSPWLSGGTLRDPGPRPLPVATVVALAEGIGSALDALHAAGWVHGDVSHGNVLFDRARPSHPVLADFGTALRVGARRARRGTLVVTPHFTAPEVWAGDRVDGRADLYSLGVVLYQTLTGAWPFEAQDLDGFAELHRRADVPRPAGSTPFVGPAVERVLLRALAKEPDGRYASGAQLARALRDALGRDGIVLPDASLLTRRDGTSPRFGAAAVASAGERLEDFAATLDAREREALRVLLRRSAAVEARASNDLEQIAMQFFAPAAALLALEESGAAAALAAGHETPADVAAACGAPERAISRLLELLAALGVLGLKGDRYRLPPGPAALYVRRARAGDAAAPLRDAAAFWAHLPSWAATGEPLAHIDRPDGAVYANAAVTTGALGAPAARELAGMLLARGLLPPEPSVLDVGAGSGVWGFAIAGGAPGATVTAVDRPLVLQETRRNAEAAGLRGRFEAVAGDWRHVPLPEATFDVVVLANICHLEPPPEVRRLLGRVFHAVRHGGLAVVVDTMPEPGSTAVGPLLQALHLALRTPGGGVHDRASYTTWLNEIGFELLDAVVLGGSAGSLTALLARRS